MLGPIFLTCHRFCDLIYLTPSFWTHISAKMMSIDIHRRIELSGAAPLAVIFNGPRFSDYRFRASFFKDIRQTLPRWQSVYIPRLSHWDYHFKAHPCLSSLRNLAISQEDEYPLAFWGCSFPKLKYLQFSSTDFCPSHTSFPSLRSCDIHLDLKKPTIGPLFEFISSNSHLRSLSIWINSHNSLTLDAPGMGIKRLCLPHLEELSLRCFYGETDICGLLRHLSLPVIRTLYLGSDLHEDSLMSPYVADMIKEGCCYPVRHLVLDREFSIASHVPYILDLFPSLHTLDLSVGQRLKASVDWSGINKGQLQKLELLRVTHSLEDPAPLWKLLHGLDLEGISVEVSSLITS